MKDYYRLKLFDSLSTSKTFQLENLHG